MTSTAPDGPSTPRGGSRTLTARELEVLALMADGASNEQIARLLDVAPATVKSHLTRAYRKIGVNNRVQATRYWLEHHATARPATASAPAPFDEPPPDQIDQHLQALAYISTEAQRLREHLRSMRTGQQRSDPGP
jgi:DNA-binding CsgD family transcriptional regulator